MVWGGVPTDTRDNNSLGSERTGGGPSIFMPETRSGFLPGCQAMDSYEDDLAHASEPKHLGLPEMPEPFEDDHEDASQEPERQPEVSA